jgi:tRNA modification GTPase
MGGSLALREGPMVLRERHRQALEEACQAVGRALEGIDERRPSELLASDLRDACEALGRITGRSFTEDLLDSIFEEFCLGK